MYEIKSTTKCPNGKSTKLNPHEIKSSYSILALIVLLFFILATTNIGSHSIRNLQMRNYVEFIRSQPDRNEEEDEGEEDDNNSSDDNMNVDQVGKGINKWIYF